MNIRKANKNDILEIAEIYDKIHTEEEKGNLCIGWTKGVYPVRETAEKALNRDDLFVIEEDNKILGSAIINQRQEECYKEGNWNFKAPDEEIMVMHTLTIDPDYPRKGVGSCFVKFYEDYAVSKGCKALRIDTQEKNTVAREMYKKYGFSEIGTVICVFNGIPDAKLVLIEKELEKY